MASNAPLVLEDKEIPWVPQHSEFFLDRFECKVDKMRLGNVEPNLTVSGIISSVSDKLQCSWKKRYIVFEPSVGCVHYWKSREQRENDPPKGSIFVHDVQVDNHLEISLGCRHRSANVGVGVTASLVSIATRSIQTGNVRYKFRFATRRERDGMIARIHDSMRFLVVNIIPRPYSTEDVIVWVDSCLGLPHLHQGLRRRNVDVNKLIRLDDRDIEEIISASSSSSSSPSSSSSSSPSLPSMTLTLEQEMLLIKEGIQQVKKSLMQFKFDCLVRFDEQINQFLHDYFHSISASGLKTPKGMYAHLIAWITARIELFLPFFNMLQVSREQIEALMSSYDCKVKQMIEEGGKAVAIKSASAALAVTAMFTSASHIPLVGPAARAILLTGAAGFLGYKSWRFRHVQRKKNPYDHIERATNADIETNMGRITKLTKTFSSSATSSVMTFEDFLVSGSPASGKIDNSALAEKMLNLSLWEEVSLLSRLIKETYENAAKKGDRLRITCPMCNAIHEDSFSIHTSTATWSCTSPTCRCHVSIAYPLLSDSSILFSSCANCGQYLVGVALSTTTSTKMIGSEENSKLLYSTPSRRYGFGSDYDATFEKEATKWLQSQIPASSTQPQKVAYMRDDILKVHVFDMGSQRTKLLKGLFDPLQDPASAQFVYYRSTTTNIAHCYWPSCNCENFVILYTDERINWASHDIGKAMAFLKLGVMDFLSFMIAK